MKKFFRIKKIVLCLFLLMFSLVLAKNSKNQVHWSVSTPIDLKKKMSVVDISSFRGNLQAVRQLETMLLKEGFQVIVQPEPEILSVEGLKAQRKLEREQAEEARRQAEEMAIAQREKDQQEEDNFNDEDIEDDEIRTVDSATENQKEIVEEQPSKNSKNTKAKKQKKNKSKSELKTAQAEQENLKQSFEPELVIKYKETTEPEKSDYILQITYKLYETHRDYAMIDATATDQQMSAVGGYGRFSCEQLIVTVIDAQQNRLAVFAFESNWFPQDLQKVFALFIKKLKTETEVTAYR